MKKIGVLGNFFLPERTGAPSPFGAYYVNRDYHDSFLLQGALPVSVPYLDFAAFSSAPESRCDCTDYCSAFLELVDGLVLTGGFDVPSGFFGQEELAGASFTYDERRVRFELELLKVAESLRLPVLGICLGLQVYNVFRGGTLVQDIEIQRPEALDHRLSCEDSRVLAHQVSLRPDSILSDWCQVSQLAVNSSHHQAVDKPGEGLLINAESADGLIEGLESKDGLFVGVQWHPESLQYSMDSHRRIFSAFVDGL
jgi:putative glutamine amidotransferase